MWIPTRPDLSRVARGRYPLGVIALASTIALLAVLALHNSSGASAATKAHAKANSTRPKARFPAFHDAVPVLLYHRLRPQSGFDAQMRRLHDLGFEAITLDQYIRFVRGKAVGLPPRPVLLTFDDGYPSAWKKADPVLARYGWSAVMYVPTGYVGHPGFLSWEELRQMRSSGRWQIDEHAGNGHVLITADAAGPSCLSTQLSCGRTGARRASPTTSRACVATSGLVRPRLRGTCPGGPRPAVSRSPSATTVRRARTTPESDHGWGVT